MRDNKQTSKIELLSQWKLEAEFRNIWFVWSKTSYCGDKWRCYRCGTNNKQQTLKIELLSQWMIKAEFRNTPENLDKY